MKFSTGFFDSIFGEKVILEIPSEDGRILKRTVTKKWLEQMQRQGKMGPVNQSLVRAHVLSPGSYVIENWIIGRDITADACERFRDPITKDIYVMTVYEAGEPNTRILQKSLWLEAKKLMDSV